METTLRKPGIILIGIKMLPKNMSIKNALIEIGVALLALLISPVSAKPMLRKHSAPKVSTNQNKK